MIAGRWRRHAQAAAELLAPLAHLAVVLGIVVAGFAYLSEIQRSKIDASISYLERFNTDRVLDDRNTVYAFWRAQDRDILNLMSPNVFEQFILKEIGQAPATEHEIPLVNLVDFFDGMQVCIATGVCEAEVLRAVLMEYAVNLHCNYRAFIIGQRDPIQGGLASFGLGLEEFIGNNGTCAAVP